MRLTGLTREIVAAALKTEKRLHGKMCPPVSAVKEAAKYLFEQECAGMNPHSLEPQDAWERLKPDARMAHLQTTVELFSRLAAINFRVVLQKRGGPQRE